MSKHTSQFEAEDAESTANQEALQDEIELDKQRDLVQSIMYNMLQKSDGDVTVVVNLLLAMQEATKSKSKDNEEESLFLQAIRCVISNMEIALFGDFVDEI
jgi:hypothetical protein